MRQAWSPGPAIMYPAISVTAFITEKALYTMQALLAIVPVEFGTGSYAVCF